MPPRYAYWTILVDDQPTAFRSGSQEELMPTFKRLQQKHPSAKMMWWQNGKLWNSRLDAQEAMRARGEIGRSRDFRQTLSERGSRGHRDSKPIARSGQGEERNPSGKLDWKPKSQDPRPRTQEKREGGPEWKPKGTFKPERSARPDWKPKSDWKPKGRAEGFRPASTDRRPAGGKLEWRPKGDPTASAAEGGGPRRSAEREGGPEKRKWVPKAEYKKSLGIEAKKDKNWRPGGEHKDPRQKYKDAKKAKWGRFKQTVRKRWESKAKKNDK